MTVPAAALPLPQPPLVLPFERPLAEQPLTLERAHRLPMPAVVMTAQGIEPRMLTREPRHVLSVKPGKTWIRDPRAPAWIGVSQVGPAAEHDPRRNRRDVNADLDADGLSRGRPDGRAEQRDAECDSKC